MQTRETCFWKHRRLFYCISFFSFHLLESGRTVRKHGEGEIITWHAAKSKPNSLPPIDDIFSRLHLGFLSKAPWAWWKTSGLFSFINVASYLWFNSKSSLKSSHWSTVSTTEFMATSGNSNRLISMTEHIRVGNDWEVWSQTVGSQTCVSDC